MSIITPSTPSRPSVASAILDVVELVQRLKQERRKATAEEQERLARWMGWGPVAPALEYSPRNEWKEIGAELRMLLGPEGTKDAREATPYSFFTDRYMIDAIWQLAMDLGFTGGRVLEPGCGSGAFFAAAPSHLDLQFTGIERESFSASVAQLRHPSATIINKPIEEIVLRNEAFDLVVGNVPFSETHTYDSEVDRKLSLHNYCIWRSIKALRPDGLAILITTHYTLDAKEKEQRKIIQNEGVRFLGAIRLPSGAHKAAKTEVVTDILIFQKLHERDILRKDKPSSVWLGHPWIETTKDILPGIDINEYFLHRPNHLVGTPLVAEHGMYARRQMTVQSPDDVSGTLQAVVQSIVDEAKSHDALYRPPLDVTAIRQSQVILREDGMREGAFYIVEGQLVQVIDGEMKSVTRNVAELTHLVMLKEAALKLLDAEKVRENSDDALIPLRNALNDAYDVYVKNFVAIHRATISVGEEDPETGERKITRRRPTAMYAFSRDPDYPIVLGLEEYDDTTQQAKKAAIFSRRINILPRRKMKTNDPSEALSLSLDTYGLVKLDYIASLLSLQVEKVPDLLGDAIYHDPVTQRWLTTSAYLSGYVREKLKQAQEAAEREPDRYQRNVEALEKVQPEDLLPEEIRAMLGATWIRPEDIAQFCRETFELHTTVSYDRLTGSWDVTYPYNVDYCAKATSEWGTGRAHAYRLVENGLNKKVPTIYDMQSDGSLIKNPEETLAAQEKLQKIQDYFSEWIWADEERAMRLAAVYNETFNAVIPRTYDGSHLSFPGMSDEWANNLYYWQKDYVYRMTDSRAALCGYPVGAGKTTIEISGAMKLRQLGLVSKAAIVVPNHLLEQITAEAQRLYPSARILMISRDDLSKDRRKLFAARIATGDYDFVVMTHSGLTAIGVHPETERAYIEKRVAAYEEALQGVDNDRKNKRTVKRIQKLIDGMRQRQKELLNIRHDDGVTFEQLGVSYLIIDESHLYKNLGLPTNIQGLQVRPAKRAIDLEMKLRWLEEHNEGRPFVSFFTATPISNSTVEAYVIAWYLNQYLINDYGLTNVDAFASVFIDFQTKVEVSPNGASFRLHTRPARFVNMPEFMALFTQFADLRGPEILDAKRPKRREYTISVEPTEQVQDFVNKLVGRSEDIHRGVPQLIHGKDDNMLWVTTDGRKAALDLSLVGIAQVSSPKLEAVANEMLKIYHRWQKEADYLDGEFKSLQIGFCDLGTPNEEKGDQIYGKIKRLLIEGGIPRHGIRYIHEAKGDSAKSALFQQCRSGQVAVLLGSTPMLGTGTNIQTRAAALHHIDAPWRPDEVEQREGRVQRPGNLFPEVEIFRYVQKRTFDAYSWQILANKAIPFDQMRSGKVKSRILEISDSALSYGQVKAAATGDPLVLEQAEVNINVSRLQQLKLNHSRARHRDLNAAKNGRAIAENLRSEAVLYQNILDHAAKCEQVGFVTKEGISLEDRTEIGAYIAERIQNLMFYGGTEMLGFWSGCRLWVNVVSQKDKYDVSFQLFGSTQKPLRISVGSWTGEKSRWRYAATIEDVFAMAKGVIQQNLARAEDQFAHAANFERAAKEPFEKEEELQTLLGRKRKLDTYTAMSASASKADEEKLKELAAMRIELLQDMPDIMPSEKEQAARPTMVPPPRRPASVTLQSVQSAPAPTPAAPTVQMVAKTPQPVKQQPEPAVIPTPPTTTTPKQPEPEQIDVMARWKELKEQYPAVSLRGKKKGAKKKEKKTTQKEQPSLWDYVGADDDECEEEGTAFQQPTLFH